MVGVIQEAEESRSRIPVDITCVSCKDSKDVKSSDICFPVLDQAIFIIHGEEVSDQSEGSLEL